MSSILPAFLIMNDTKVKDAEIIFKTTEITLKTTEAAFNNVKNKQTRFQKVFDCLEERCLFITRVKKYYNLKMSDSDFIIGLYNFININVINAEIAFKNAEIAFKNAEITLESAKNKQTIFKKYVETKCFFTIQEDQLSKDPVLVNNVREWFQYELSEKLDIEIYNIFFIKYNISRDLWNIGFTILTPIDKEELKFDPKENNNFFFLNEKKIYLWKCNDPDNL